MIKPLAFCANATELFESLTEMAAEPSYVTDQDHIRYWLGHRGEIERLSVLYGTRPQLGSKRFIEALKAYLQSHLVTGGIMHHDEVLPSRLTDEESRAYAWLADQLDPQI